MALERTPVLFLVTSPVGGAEIDSDAVEERQNRVKARPGVHHVQSAC